MEEVYYSWREKNYSEGPEGEKIFKELHKKYSKSPIVKMMWGKVRSFWENVYSSYELPSDTKDTIFSHYNENFCKTFWNVVKHLREHRENLYRGLC